MTDERDRLTCAAESDAGAKSAGFGEMSDPSAARGSCLHSSAVNGANAADAAGSADTADAVNSTDSANSIKSADSADTGVHIRSSYLPPCYFKVYCAAILQSYYIPPIVISVFCRLSSNSSSVIMA